MHVAVDAREKLGNVSRVQGLAGGKFVCGFEPIHTAILAGDEAIEGLPPCALSRSSLSYHALPHSVGSG